MQKGQETGTICNRPEDFYTLYVSINKIVCHPNWCHIDVSTDIKEHQVETVRQE